MSIVIRGTWTQQWRLRTVAQRSKDRGLMRRALAISWLMQGQRVTAVADSLAAARSSVYRWVSWFESGGLEKLRPGSGGRSAYPVNEALLKALEALLEGTPRTFGYLRATWSSALLSGGHSQPGTKALSSPWLLDTQSSRHDTHCGLSHAHRAASSLAHQLRPRPSPCASRSWYP